jgi:hypothetical protein
LALGADAQPPNTNADMSTEALSSLVMRIFCFFNEIAVRGIITAMLLPGTTALSERHGPV